MQSNKEALVSDLFLQFACISFVCRCYIVSPFTAQTDINIDRCGNHDMNKRSAESKNWNENSCLPSGALRTRMAAQHLPQPRSNRRHHCLTISRPILEVVRRAATEGGGGARDPILALVAAAVMWNLRPRRCLLSSNCPLGFLPMMIMTTMVILMFSLGML